MRRTREEVVHVGVSGFRSSALLLGAAAVVPLLGACGGAVNSDATGAASASSTSASAAGPSTPAMGDEPTVATPPPPAPGPSCRPAGESTGPAAPVASVRLTLPATGASGSTLVVTTALVVRADAPRVVLQPGGSGVAVLRGDAVVAFTGGHGTIAVPLPLTSGATLPAQVVPETLALTGCDGLPLPPGRYTVRAIVGYGVDPLNAGAADGSRGFQLVSAAVPLTVT